MVILRRPICPVPFPLPIACQSVCQPVPFPLPITCQSVCQPVPFLPTSPCHSLSPLMAPSVIVNTQSFTHFFNSFLVISIFWGGESTYLLKYEELHKGTNINDLGWGETQRKSTKEIAEILHQEKINLKRPSLGKNNSQNQSKIPAGKINPFMIFLWTPRSLMVDP